MRGVLFTVSLVLVAISVFSFASIILSEYEGKRADEAQLFAVDRVFYVFRSVEADLRDIFPTSGMSVHVRENVVSFREEVPNTEDAEFRTNIDRYEGFVEKNGIALDTSDIKNRLTIKVEPLGAEYTHPDYGGDRIEFNTPEPPEAYQLHITLETGSANKFEWGPYSAGSLPVNVFVGGVQDKNETTLINPSGLSVLNITLTANQGTIEARFEEGNMTLTSYAASTIEVETNVTLDGRMQLGLPGALSVWTTGASKNGTVRLA